LLPFMPLLSLGAAAAFPRTGDAVALSKSDKRSMLNKFTTAVAVTAGFFASGDDSGAGNTTAAAAGAGCGGGGAKVKSVKSPDREAAGGAGVAAKTKSVKSLERDAAGAGAANAAALTEDDGNDGDEANAENKSSPVFVTTLPLLLIEAAGTASVAGADAKASKRSSSSSTVGCRAGAFGVPLGDGPWNDPKLSLPALAPAPAPAAAATARPAEGP
jgi:hypothetical protein